MSNQYRFDFDEVRKALSVMTVGGQVWEIRALGATWATDAGRKWRRTLSGYFNDAEKCVSELARIGSASGVYITLNPVQSDLLARACNRLVEAEKEAATKDHQVTERRWLLVDIDPVRAQGISSSDEELAVAAAKADTVATELAKAGWPEPVRAMSGNGHHLLWRVDLVPNQGDQKADKNDVLRRTLLGLSARHSDGKVSIDESVFNASRIDKLYGSMACKGDHCPELGRPHRMSRIISVPAETRVVTTEMLLAVAAPEEEQPKADAIPAARTAGEKGNWDLGRAIERIEGWIGSGKIDVLRTERRADGAYYMLRECPWASAHTGADGTQDAAIIVRGGGAYGFKCFHSHCSGRSWQDVKEKLGLAADRPSGDGKAAAREGRAAAGVYYDSQRKEYLLRNGRGVWLSLTEGQLRKELAARGHRMKARKSEALSEVDRIILGIRDRNDVAYSGQLAGYSSGFYETGEHRMLVTTSPRIIEPKAGGFPTLDRFLSGLLDEEGFRQRDHLHGWLKVAYEALRRGERRPGQALAMAGPHDCGKSVFQLLVTEILGGRYARPYQYMMGLTQFNSDLFEAEHLVMEDESSSTDIRARRSFGAQIKQVTVVEAQRCHAKNRPALSIRPFWRLTISLNDETENLMVLPPLDDSIEDKIIILRAHRSPMPMPTGTAGERKAFWDTLVSELPAFLHWLAAWEIPAELRSERFGVTHFHHPAILSAIDALSPEARLLSIIDSAIFAARTEEWEGTADALEKELASTDSAVSYEARRLFTFNTACGVYLGRLAKKHPGRFRHSHCRDVRRWVILPPGGPDGGVRQGDGVFRGPEERRGGHQPPSAPEDGRECDRVTGFFLVMEKKEEVNSIINCPIPRHPVTAGPLVAGTVAGTDDGFLDGDPLSGWEGVGQRVPADDGGITNE